MDVAIPPRAYLEWREGEFARSEDAAYAFGFYLIKHCRDEALAGLPSDATPEMKAAVRTAVNTALHNVCDMLEGFFPLSSGPDHNLSFALGVEVRDANHQVVETQEISPCKLDLPIGYWKWADREFR